MLVAFPFEVSLAGFFKHIRCAVKELAELGRDKLQNVT